MNTTLDAVCDHTVGVVDAQLHEHYTELVRKAGLMLYGRKTYELMQYWQGLLDQPVPAASMNQFAQAIDRVPKLVFSNTMQHTGWTTAILAQSPLVAEVAALRQGRGGDVLVGSRSLIVQLLNLGFVDEFQLCLHPLVAGAGLPLFQGLEKPIQFKLLHTKTFDSGVKLLYYQPLNIAKRQPEQLS